MTAINIGTGADGPLASLEFNTKYDTTFFPSDLADTPYFIIFRAKKEYRFSQLADVKPKFIQTSGGGSSTTDPVTGEINIEITRFGRKPADLVNTVLAGVKKVGGAFKTLSEDFGIDIVQPAHSFALPIPSNLSTSYNAQYNTADLGPLGAEARNVAAGTVGQSNSLTKNLIDAVKNQDYTSDDLKGVLGNLGIAVAGAETATSALIGALSGGVAGAAAAAAAGSIGTGALVGLGIARNPHIANVFTGVNFRQHSFQYKLIAKNKKESDAIRDLIRNFKFHMAPDYKAERHVFTYPSKFQIILRAGDYLFKIGDSVLTSFEVNYNGEGAPYFFEDTNAPYSIDINMTFIEDTIVTKKEIRQGR